MSLTAYAACKLVNDNFKALGIDKQLPAQMFYTYFKKQYIKNTNKLATVADVNEWFDKYMNKHHAGEVVMVMVNNIEE